jgi:hypothetical protein
VDTDGEAIWMTVSAAAALLGQSARHIRNRAKGGVIEARRTEAGDWLVLVANGRPVPAVPKPPQAAVSVDEFSRRVTAGVSGWDDDGLNATLEMVALRNEIAVLRGEKERLEERLAASLAETRKWHAAVVSLTTVLGPTPVSESEQSRR